MVQNNSHHSKLYEWRWYSVNTCEKCKRPIISAKDFEEIAGRPYLLAIADQEFLNYLKRGEKNANV